MAWTAQLTDGSSGEAERIEASLCPGGLDGDSGGSSSAGEISVEVTASRAERRTSGILNSPKVLVTASLGSARASRTSSWKLADMRRKSATNRPNVRAASGSRFGPNTMSAIIPTRKSFSGLKFSTEIV